MDESTAFAIPQASHTACSLTRCPAAVYIHRLGPGSRRAMEMSLRQAVEIMTEGKQTDPFAVSWEAFDYSHSQALRTKLAERYAPATANRTLCALRGAFRECWRLGMMSTEAYHRAIDVETIKGERLLRGRALSPSELRALFQVCADDPSPAGRRDAAMLGILIGTGMRRSDIVKIDRADYDSQTGTLVVRHAKGDNDLIVYASNGAKDAVDEWIEVRGSEPGPLIPHIHRGGRLTLKRLSDQAVFHVLRKRGEQAGVKPFSPHDLRRTLISNLLDLGVDLSTAQKMAGHASPTTTVRYDRRGEVAKQRAAAMLAIPFTPTKQT